MKAYEYLLEFKDKAINNVKKLARESGILDKKTEKLGDEMKRTENKSRRMGHEFDRTSRKGFRLGRMFGGLRGHLASFLTITALIAGTANLSKAASEYEQIGIAFETMLGSAERSKNTIRDLNNFANVTPFTNDQVFKASKSLLAYNIEAEELIPTLTALGNISAGVGREKLPQLILAYGQVKAATRLTGMELRQFTEAGVPLLDELAKVTGKSVAVIKEELIPQGRVGFDLVKEALFNATREGGKFFRLMEKQSQSFGGRISTLQGKAQLLSIAYGEGLNKFFRPAIEGAIKQTDRLLEATKSTEDLYKEQIKRTQELESNTVPLIRRYEELTSKAKLNKEEQTEVKEITQQLAEAIPSAVTKWNRYGEAIGLSTTKLKENITYSKEALKLLNKDLIKEKQNQIKDLQDDATKITSTLNEIADYGGVRQRRRQQGEYFTFIKRFSDQEINDLRSKLQGMTGDNGLISALEKEIKALSGETQDPGVTGGNSGDANGNGSGVDSAVSSGIDGITAGGGKNVTINFQGGIKFAENIDITAQDLSDGLDQLEPKMREFFIRLLQGGLHTALG